MTEAINTTPAPGSGLLEAINKTPLTDTVPGTTDVYTTIVETRAVRDVICDLTTSHGCSVVITPIRNDEGTPEYGLASDTGTIADGGGSLRPAYSDIGAPRAEIKVTKTEAGDMTTFELAIRGRV